MLFIEGNVDIFFKWPKKQGRRGTLAYSYSGMWSIERTLRTSTNNGFQDQYGNPLSLLELQQTKRRLSFFLVRQAKPARHENDQSAALVSRALGARARVHFSH